MFSVWSEGGAVGVVDSALTLLTCLRLSPTEPVSLQLQVTAVHSSLFIALCWSQWWLRLSGKLHCAPLGVARGRSSHAGQPRPMSAQAWLAEESWRGRKEIASTYVLYYCKNDITIPVSSSSSILQRVLIFTYLPNITILLSLKNLSRALPLWLSRVLKSVQDLQSLILGPSEFNGGLPHVVNSLGVEWVEGIILITRALRHS